MKKDSFHRLWFPFICIIIIIFLRRISIFPKDYFLYFLIMIIGFSFATTRSIIKEGQKRYKEEKTIKEWIGTYLNYILTFAIAFNIIYPIINKILKTSGDIWPSYIRIGLFLLLGFEIDSVFKKGSIFDGILDFLRKIRVAIFGEKRNS